MKTFIFLLYIITIIGLPIKFTSIVNKEKERDMYLASRVILTIIYILIFVFFTTYLLNWEIMEITL